ncbi:MAG: cation-translocating P-type ATPase [Candidatus Nanoarchaeia archaeon]
MTSNNKYWHLRTVDEVYSEVNTSSSGLTEHEAKKRLKEGKNVLELERGTKWYHILAGKINSLLIYILFAAGIISLSTGDVIEFAVIMVIILMTVMLGFYQEYRADKTVSALKKLTAKGVHVLRDGKVKEVPAEELVPGDIVYLKRGDIVPADLRVADASGLEIDEAHLTGESVYSVKSTQHLEKEDINLAEMENLAFSSTFVTKGSGKGIVVETGLNTYIGKISSSIEHIKDTKSPIQQKIDYLSKRISYIVLSVAAFLLLILLFQGEPLSYSLIMVAAVAVAGIPESFPLTLTLAFTNGIKKMARQNAIVKDLNSVETLGATTVICTDKTGTLTENKMRVTKFYVPGHMYSAVGYGYEPVNTFYENQTKVNAQDMGVSEDFIKACVLCNDAELSFEEEWTLYGEPTEGALLCLAKSLNAQEHVLREDNKRVHLEPFDPSRKYMVSVNKNIDTPVYEYYMKGAAEIVLDKCKYYKENGEIKEFRQDLRDDIRKKIEDLNKDGLRVLSLASKKLENVTSPEKHTEGDYVFEGFLGIEDPIREEVYESVSQCTRAGIKTIMITGDNKLIAEHIATRLGMYDNSKRIVEGFEIDKLTDRELDEIIREIAIFARATPEHKLRIVNSLQRKGEVVAMTGDGVNDAPALKKADIGVSMGKEGTEVAREASNMVLTDDNFATIVKAVKEGRTVYSNIRRFIYYLLTGNFTELSLIFITIFLGFFMDIPMPLTALMILFVNLVTSTIPALALSVEPTHYKVMKQKPRNKNEKILNNYILTKILILIPILLAGTFGLYLWELNTTGHVARAMTMAFATIISFELFHSFNARRLHTTIFDNGFFNNRYLFLAVFTSLLLTIAAIHSKTAQTIFSTVALTGFEWLIIGLTGFSIIIFSEIVKYRIKTEFEEQSKLQGVEIKLE